MANIIDYNQISSQISLIILTHFKLCNCHSSNVESLHSDTYNYKGSRQANKDGSVSNDDDDDDNHKQNSLDKGSGMKTPNSKRTKKSDKLLKHSHTDPPTSKRTKKPRRTAPPTTKHPRLDITPKLMIFETDWMLWPFHYETDVVLPYDLVQPTAWPIPKGGEGRRWCTGNFGGRELVDGNGKCLQLNYDALVVFYKLQHRGIKMALVGTVNNSSKIDGMKQLIRLFEFDYVISSMEVDEGTPMDHVRTIKQNSGLEFRDLVYFGINKTILEELEKELKVITVYVDPNKGLDVKDVQEGGRLYAIRPHVPGPFETPLTVGKIVSNEEAANIYGPEVMKMEERSECGSISGNVFNSSEEETPVDISDFHQNITMFNL